VDSSFHLNGSRGGAGMALRNADGQFIFSACRYLQRCDDAFEAELQACTEGLELALARTDLPIIIESDYAQLVQAATWSSTDRSPYNNLVLDIRLLLSQRLDFSIVKVVRVQVRVSHCLANFARTEHRSMIWLGSGPECVLQELEQELLNEIYFYPQKNTIS
jgi:ribonuclease HI